MGASHPLSVRLVNNAAWSLGVIVILAAIVICFVATIYPSRQASKLDPAQALRYQ